MAIIKCDKGHYYDDRRYSECPYCEKLQKAKGFDSSANENKTQYKYDIPAKGSGNVTQYYGEDVGDSEKTISIYHYEGDNLLVAGWLVCVSGPDKGRSCNVYSGRNFAGRSESMDIVFYGDKSISRERHFSIVYDPKSNSFFAVEGKGSAFINGELLTVKRELVENDRIEAGESEFCFVPFCKGERHW